MTQQVITKSQLPTTYSCANSKIATVAIKKWQNSLSYNTMQIENPQNIKLFWQWQGNNLEW